MSSGTLAVFVLLAIAIGAYRTLERSYERATKPRGTRNLMVATHAILGLFSLAPSLVLASEDEPFLAAATAVCALTQFILAALTWRMYRRLFDRHQ